MRTALVALITAVVLNSCGLTDAAAPMVFAGTFVENLAHGDYSGAKLGLADQTLAASMETDPQWDALRNSPSYTFQFRSQKINGDQADVVFIDPKGNERTIHLVKRMERKHDVWFVQSIK